jgi:hypothetical protein
MKHGFKTASKHIHQLWHQIFGDTPVTSTKLIVGNCNSRNAIKTFIRRRPHTIQSEGNRQNFTLN